MRKYYEQLFANKLENLDKMNTFLGRHKLPKLTQAEIKNLNRLTTSKKIELVIKKVATVPKIIRGSTLSNSFY